MSPCWNQLSQVSAPVYYAVILFSMSTWLDVVGVWVEMPLLVKSLPEGWKLPSYLAIIIQLANIGPATYAIVTKIRSGKARKKAARTGGGGKDIEVILAVAIIGLAALSVFLMSFFWDRTVRIGAEDRSTSVALLSLMATTALSSCMSSVVFLPFMARFATPYISAYYIGQGFSGLVPGLIGLLQGAGSPKRCTISEIESQNHTSFNPFGNETFLGDNFTSGHHDLSSTATPTFVKNDEPLFSVSTFFRCLTVLFLISGVAFYFLNFTKRSRAAMLKRSTDLLMTVNEKNDKEKSEQQHLDDVELKSSNGAGENMENGHSFMENDKTEEKDGINEKPASEPLTIIKQKKRMNFVTFIILLVIVGVVNALSNGLLPSTQSYTCLPYGFLIYTLAIRLSSVAGPLASLSSMLLPRASVPAVFSLALLGTLIAFFHIGLAAQSPNPILRGHVAGEIIVIVTSVIMAVCFSFVRVSVALVLHEGGGRRELLWCGGITQVGSFCGASIAFLLVNVFHVFTSGKKCS